MTITYATEHAAHWRTLFDWLYKYSGLDSSKVRKLNQVAGRPDLPYANMQVIADVAEGIEGDLWEHDTGTDKMDSVTYGPRRMTLQCNMYTTVEGDDTDIIDNAMSRLTAAVHALRIPPVKASFKSNGIAFLRAASSIRSDDEQLGQRWERRATIDLEFSYTALTVLIGEEDYLVSVDIPTETDNSLIIQE